MNADDTKNVAKPQCREYGELSEHGGCRECGERNGCRKHSNTKNTENAVRTVNAENAEGAAVAEDTENTKNAENAENIANTGHMQNADSAGAAIPGHLKFRGDRNLAGRMRERNVKRRQFREGRSFLRSGADVVLRAQAWADRFNHEWQNQAQTEIFEQRQLAHEKNQRRQQAHTKDQHRQQSNTKRWQRPH